VTKGDLGTAALPGKEEDFKKSIEMAINYAKALKCNRCNLFTLNKLIEIPCIHFVKKKKK
jgi:hydroxypyruvate isomerase